MIFFTVLTAISMVLKACRIKRAISKMKRAKLNAYRRSIGVEPIYPCYQRPFRFIFKCCFNEEGEEPSFCSKLFTFGTLPNTVLTSFLGFVSGLFLTYSLLAFLIIQLGFGISISLWISLTFGFFCTFGLAFNADCRCFLLLLITQMFTRRGRTGILAYSLILALSGPARNTAENMEILSESLICGQELVKKLCQSLIDLVRHPWSILKSVLANIIKEVKLMAEKVKAELKKIVNPIISVLDDIQSAWRWLKVNVEVCNTVAGTPFERCEAAFEEAVADCKHQLGSVMDWMCSVADASKYLCHVAKIVDVLCWLPSLVKEQIFSPIKQEVKNFFQKIKEFFDIRLAVDHDFKHELSRSKEFKEIFRGIKEEIWSKIGWLFKYIRIVDFIACGFFYLFIFKTWRYKWRFISTDFHDNIFLTKGMVKMDRQRRKLGKEIIFPIKTHESRYYIDTWSINLAQSEKSGLYRSLILVSFSSGKILNFVYMDYLLYQFLLIVREYGALKVDFKEVIGDIKVEGEGFLADLYRAMLKSLSEIGDIFPPLDTTPCLPIPSVPNYNTYKLIILLIVLCYVLSFLEPYGLRLRHVICEIYYPERIVARDRWLYTHILISRDNFLQFTRRQLNDKFNGNERNNPEYKITLLDRLTHMAPCCLRFLRIFGFKSGVNCFLCGRKGDEDDEINFVKCFNCATPYCIGCFKELEEKCPACMESFHFEDDGESEERGSEPDEDMNEMKPNLIKRRN